MSPPRSADVYRSALRIAAPRLAPPAFPRCSGRSKTLTPTPPLDRFPPRRSANALSHCDRIVRPITSDSAQTYKLRVRLCLTTQPTQPRLEFVDRRVVDHDRLLREHARGAGLVVPAVHLFSDLGYVFQAATGTNHLHSSHVPCVLCRLPRCRRHSEFRLLAVLAQGVSQGLCCPPSCWELWAPPELLTSGL